MKQPWIPALIFSLIILGCFLLGALIDKYFRMKAMREFARRYKEAEANERAVRITSELSTAELYGYKLPMQYAMTDSIDSPQPPL